MTGAHDRNPEEEQFLKDEVASNQNLLIQFETNQESTPTVTSFAGEGADVVIEYKQSGVQKQQPEDCLTILPAAQLALSNPDTHSTHRACRGFGLEVAPDPPDPERGEDKQH